jgi:hypothetical protein
VGTHSQRETEDKVHQIEQGQAQEMIMLCSAEAKGRGLCSYCGIYGHKGSECKKRLGKKVENGRPVDSADPQIFQGLASGARRSLSIAHKETIGHKEMAKREPMCLGNLKLP